VKKILILLFICFLFPCCDNEDCTKITTVEIEEERSIPDTVLNNEQVQIIIKASATNLCWRDLYVEFKEKDQFEYSLKAYGTYTCCKGGCACAASMLYMDTVIYFQPTQKGTYLFNISETRNRIVIDTMIVK
jgi:hypothetical protein